MSIPRTKYEYARSIFCKMHRNQSSDCKYKKAYNVLFQSNKIFIRLLFCVVIDVPMPYIAVPCANSAVSNIKIWEVNNIIS